MLDDLEELRREAEALQRTFAAGHDPAAPHAGKDGAGAVQVIVDGDGRVASVELDRSWRETVGYDLGAAVVEAVSDATMRRLASWAQDVANAPAAEGPASEQGAGRLSNITERAPRTAKHADSAEARQAVQEILSLLRGIEDDLDDLDRRINQRIQKQVVGRGPGNMVTVTMTGDGQVTDVDINRRFLDQALERRITQELLGAFESAHERAGKLSLDALLGDGKLAELYGLGRDPAALLSRLGFGSR